MNITAYFKCTHTNDQQEVSAINERNKDGGNRTYVQLRYGCCNKHNEGDVVAELKDGCLEIADGFEMLIV